MWTNVRALVALVVTLGTGVLGGCFSATYRTACSNSFAGSVAGPITDPALTEISGIETGVANPAVWWVHNDSGHPNVLYALDSTGAVRGTYTVTGANAVDWEDLTVGPGPTAGSGTVYVGDIGDNATARSEIQVYRFTEPSVPLSGAPVSVALPTVDVLHLTYPDGAHDAETLMYDPLTGDLVIVTKLLTGGTVGVYRVPADVAAGSTTALVKVRDLTLPSGLANAVTGGDIAPDGQTIALRTYGGVRFTPRLPSWTLATAIGAQACTVTVPGEIQGEAVAFDATPKGTGVVTVAEGAGQTLHLAKVP